jgi:hypothetical protein
MQVGWRVVTPDLTDRANLVPSSELGNPPISVANDMTLRV